MTKQEILQHFSNRRVYRFDGSVEEMKLVLANTSFGYIIVSDIIYVCPNDAIDDIRAIEITLD